MRMLYQSVMLLVMMTVLCGIAYPLLVHGIAQTFRSDNANGSLVDKDGVIVGSALLAQRFDDERYLWPRPSAQDYATVPSGASNLGPTSAALKHAMKERRVRFARAHRIRDDEVPVDMITTSASGLDPHISLASAMIQAKRVARVRKLDEQHVITLINEHISAGAFAEHDEKIVNVLMINVNLDKIDHHDRK